MEQNKTLTSRRGFIVVAMGHAIGIGNIWRFSRGVIANGGGAFMVAYFVALLIWSMPLIMAEEMLVGKTRKGTVEAFRHAAGESYTWMGGWVAFVCFALGAYYSVIVGWSIRFFVNGLRGTLEPGVDVMALWNNFNPVEGVSFHFISVVLTGFIVFRKINSGLEKVSKFVIPALFALLILGVALAINLPNGEEGLKCLLNPDLGQLLSGKLWLDAFVQSAWTTGAGWGFMTIYHVNTRKEEEVAKMSFLPGLAGVLAALFATVAVASIVSLGLVSKSKAPMHQGFAFLGLAQLYSHMPGGTAVGTMFLLGMSLAAIPSLCAMYEVVIKNFTDAGWKRERAAVLVATGSFLAGIPLAINMEFCNNQDQVWGVGLLISGLMMTLTLKKHEVKISQAEDTNSRDYMKVGRYREYRGRFSPGIFLGIFSWWLHQQLTLRHISWWNPLEVSSPMTMFVQWGILMTFFLLYYQVTVETKTSKDSLE